MRIVERYPIAAKPFIGTGPWKLFAPLRFVLSLVYGAAVALRRSTRRRVPISPSRPSAGRPLGARVVSIGNLEVGGGGKTPCAIALAEALAERGGRAVVVTRGYRSGVAARRLFPFIVGPVPSVRRADDVPCYTEDSVSGAAAAGESREGDAALALLIGDEAVLYRRRRIPVVIDRDRRRGVETAARLFAPTHCLLDDAFQTLDVHRDIDILLLDARRPFGNGRLFPFGTLRERPAAAARAHVVIFTRSGGDDAPPGAAAVTRGIPRFFARHEAVDLLRADGARLPLSSIVGESIVLFSGVARPDSFEALVERIGARPAASFRFADHHRYRPRDVSRMIGSFPGHGRFLTTEKDLAKAAAFFPRSVELLALTVRMEIAAAGELLDLISGGVTG